MRRFAAAVVLAVVLALTGQVAPHAAASAPSAPWTVDRVRFEPLDPAKPVGAVGVGDYRGALEVGPSPGTGGVAIINELGVEEYLRGISEVPPSWPLEAQKAQAIAARSYLLASLASDVVTDARAAGADICATDACQVYAGLAKERRAGSEAWIAAVEQTARQVLLYRDQPIVAKYSSSNGGRTVAGGRPYLPGGLADPFDAVSPHHRWRVVLPLSTVQAALGLPAPPIALTRVHRSGATVELELTGEDGSVTVLHMPATEYRKKLLANVAPDGLPQTLPSMRFSATTDAASGAVVMDGGGWGHGIGMSQWGALGRAQRGWTAPDILAAYYAGLRPVTLPPERVPSSIRVAVALGEAQATVTSAGAFRVVDGAGRVLAHAASGRWTVVPSGRGVRLVPPPGQGEPLTVTHAVDGVRGLDREMALRVRVSAPAVLRVTYAVPGQPAVAHDLGLVLTEATLPLPPSSLPGRYGVVIEADAGAGRAVAVPADFTIDRLRPPPVLEAVHAAPTAAVPAVRRIAYEQRSFPTGVAVVALAVVGAGAVRVRRRLLISAGT